MSSFKDVVGHQDVITYIQTAVSKQKVSHAYIIQGARGSGKNMLAELFAMTLLCEKQGASPCSVCHSCRQAESRSHPDIIHVTHEKPNTISVDEIREQVNNTIAIKPYQGPYKVYIIGQAERMTAQAQNALLKTIEEPPEYAVLLLLTENAQMLLPTINSRCVMLKLRNIKDTLIKKYLMDVKQVAEEKADICTAFAQGNIGRAVMLAQSECFYEILEDALHLLTHIREINLSGFLAAVEEAGKNELKTEDYLDILMIWYRDILIYKATKELERVVFKDQITYIREQATLSSYEGIEKILEGMRKAKERLRANVNFELVMELLFLTIKEN